MTTKTTTRKQTEIQSATVNRVIDRKSGKVLGYLVKSDSEQGVWYQVTWNREEHRYECTCPATKPCKHERAVSEVVKARKDIEAKQAAEQQVTIPAASAEQVAKTEMVLSKLVGPNKPAKSTAPLGSNKAAPVGVRSAPSPRPLASIPMR